ncbi:metal-dependent hydrolase [Halomarina litorea]|uniref:metal-dependent hydrolase n=1 Tax=Halomarina litorea TaxID=2961595 RepID=UPI0020C3B147|nr:metal-dependent hydrolase [Halomarina sp. BCD28]
MLFWVHAAVAYLSYRTVVRRVWEKQPHGDDIIALCGGALLPDLIDKPLTLVISSLPSRSVAHSLFVTVVLIAAMGTLAKRRGKREFGAVFALGYLSHLGADLVDYVFIPEETILFLFWPVVTEYHHISTIGDLLALLSSTPYVLAQTVVTLVASALWIHDGKPGYSFSKRSRSP